MAGNPAVGYSSTPLGQKLGIKTGYRVLAVGGPPEYKRLLGQLPRDVSFVSRAGRTVDLAHVFVVRRVDLERRLARLRSTLRADAIVWVSWPKKAARMRTDLTENVIREIALPLGFVDVKVCAVTVEWSGLKLVVRLTLR